MNKAIWIMGVRWSCGKWPIKIDLHISPYGTKGGVLQKVGEKGFSSISKWECDSHAKKADSLQTSTYVSPSIHASTSMHYVFFVFQ